MLESLCTVDCYAALDLRFDFLCGCANEQSEHTFFAERLLKRSVVAAFVLAAEDHEDAAWKGIEGFEGGVDICGFGVVVVANTGNFADEFEAMLDAGEGAHAFGNCGRFGAGETACKCGSEYVFEIVGAGNWDVLDAKKQFLVSFAIGTEN